MGKTYWILLVCLALMLCALKIYGREIGTALGPEWDRVRIGEVTYYRTYPQVVLAKESDNSSRRREYFVKCVSRLETGVEYWDFCFPAAQRGKAVHLTVDSRDSKVVGYIFP